VVVVVERTKMWNPWKNQVRRGVPQAFSPTVNVIYLEINKRKL
jgi:hypothetical protein